MRQEPSAQLPFQWVEDTAYSQGMLWNLFDANGTLLAWLHRRPAYCDRGHFLGHIDIECGLDGQDGWPNYYMSLDRGRKEIEAFCKWRLLKIPETKA